MKPWVKWLGCGALLGLLAWLVAWSIRSLTAGEGAVAWWLALGALALVPAVISLASPRVGRLADPALVAVLSAYGVAAIVGLALLVTLLIAGRRPGCRCDPPVRGAGRGGDRARRGARADRRTPHHASRAAGGVRPDGRARPIWPARSARA